ncbi:MAG TPA: hypothetical protein VEA41_01445 [Salinarimonas sp.]|nr:hypothetical protein [Salinarimonas sp.]
MADEHPRETGASTDEERVRRAFARAAAHRPILAPPPPRPKLTFDELLVEVDRIRAMTPPGSQEDSVEILRAIRDE